MCRHGVGHVTWAQFMGKDKGPPVACELLPRHAWCSLRRQEAIYRGGGDALGVQRQPPVIEGMNGLLREPDAGNLHVGVR
jgi:hypothetical protein